MGYTDPGHTWTLGEAASGFPTTLNTYLRDNLIALRTPEYTLKVYRTSNQSITNNSPVAVTWQSSVWNVGSMWSAGTNPTRFTAPIAGVYQLAATSPWASNSTGRRSLYWRKNGAGNRYSMQVQESGGLDVLTGSDTILLAANDYVEVHVLQASGAALNLLGGTEQNATASFRFLGQASAEPPMWAAPRTWADGAPAGILSPHDLNTHIRDNLTNLRYLKGIAASVYLNDDFSLESNRRGPVRWDVANFNLGGIWAGGSQFVAPVAGIYRVEAALEMDANSINNLIRGVGFVINDSATRYDTQFQQGSPSGNDVTVHGVELFSLAAGDIVEVYGYQNTDESLSLKQGPDRTRAAIQLLART